MASAPQWSIDNRVLVSRCFLFLLLGQLYILPESPQHRTPHTNLLLSHPRTTELPN